MLEYYQKYFTFNVKENETYIYLDTKILKEYIQNGLEIKHRNYIFLYLKYQKNIINNKKKYKLINFINNINLNNKISNSINFNNFNNLNNFNKTYKYYIKNIEYLYDKILNIYNN